MVWAGWRKLNVAWADLSLRAKGLVVLAIPLAALLESTFFFYLIHRADREADTWVRTSSQFSDTIESGLVDLLEGDATVHEYLITQRTERLARLQAVSDSLNLVLNNLEKLLRNEPTQLQRLKRIRQLVKDKAGIWLEMSTSADPEARPAPPHPNLFERSEGNMDALRTEIHFLRATQERRLAARVAKVAEARELALAAVAGGALWGLGGGTLAILFFTSGVSQGVIRLQQNAARLQRRLPLLPPAHAGGELGRLESELQEASVSLLRSEQERNRFFTLSLDMLCVVNLDGHFKRVNPAFTMTLGHSETEFLSNGILDFVHPLDRDSTASQLQELGQGNPMNHFENRLVCADGTYKWLGWSSVPVLADSIAFVVARDNTRQKLGEQALQKSNDRLRWVLESITDGFFSLDSTWHFAYVNPEAERLLQNSSTELLGRNIREVLPGAAKFFRKFELAEAGASAVHFEEFYTPFNQWLEVHAYPSPEGLSVYFRDITTRRQHEEGFRRSIQEKEVLLREVHHRVKNNMQVICSMLRLQASRIDDGRLSQAFKDCRERVQVMALLHDQLHRARDLSTVNMGDYIRSLAAGVFSSYGVDSAQIGLRMDLEAIPVGIDTAIPCGLIVHELVSNAVRHGFPQGATGHISIGLHIDADEHIELTVSDDGKGLPEAPSQSKSRSLGLRLVYLLAEQLEATMECSGQAGTQYRLIFKLKKSKENESNEQTSDPGSRG